jgi:hypothetical protein
MIPATFTRESHVSGSSRCAAAAGTDTVALCLDHPLARYDVVSWQLLPGSLSMGVGLGALDRGSFSRDRLILIRI